MQSKHPAFGQIKIDPSSIIIKRDLEHTYHSESYVKEALNDSMSTNQQKTPPPQTGKDKTLQSRVGVVRKTTVKPNQQTMKKDLDEPEIDTENIPVVQGSFGSFQITKTEADITENKQSSSPTRHDSHKPLSSTKTSTTTKSPTTKSTFVRSSTTTKRVPTSTPKSRPFTIKSTLNVKQRTEPTSKIDITTSKPIIPTTSISTTTLQTTTNNVSQILLDLLTNENHYKDIPKIDTLFTVPHVIDNEPWRPITKPYYETTSSTVPPIEKEVINEQNAEDRIGVAEVVEDTSILESILTPIPPVAHREKPSRKPGGLFNIDPNLAADVYVPSPVYTSFTLPTFAPPMKDMETLGSNYPKPHPIPVDKISGVVEVVQETNPTEDDGKPVERPPKEKTTSVTLNVMQFDQQDNSTEKVSIEGASILKKHNVTTSTSSTSSTSTTISTSTTTTTMTSPTSTETITVNTTDKLESREEQDNETSKENSTRRPNNKVSIIPSTSVPHHTWELVNTSTNENDTFSKHSPEKYYNDTLQAIITKNDAVFPNTTPKFPSKVSILRNLTDIIKRYSQNTPEKPVKDSDIEERHNHNKMTGSVEVVSDEDLEITTAAIVTLLPAKSNLGVNRPLRPRPKIKPTQATKENVRSFFRSDPETKKLIENLTTENSNRTQNSFLNSPEIVTSATIIDETESDDEMFLANVSESMKVESAESSPSNNRLPKSNDDLNNPVNDNIPAENKQNTDAPVLPEGTYRVSYHVTGSVSSKQANKTQSLPAYELALEPDVVLEIPYNQTNTLTIDKLKQLASLATISDSNNNTLFRAPGGVISTKAIPSSYTLNQAGFKILTKTYNKIQPSKEDNSFDKPEKTYSKPYANKFNKEHEQDNAIVKESVDKKEGKSWPKNCK